MTLFVLFAALAMSSASAGSLNRTVCFIYFYGQIEATDHAALSSALADASKDGCETALYVIFDSSGGDIKAAVAIGELLRASKAGTIVPANATCASACVIAAIGGVRRVVAGRIGLHRPYPRIGTTDEKEARARRVALNAELRSYLDRMGVPQALLEEMNAVPSGQMRWLDGADAGDRRELERLQIKGEDAAWKDSFDAKRAEKIGISVPELYRRQQRADAVCVGDMFEQFKCHQDVIEGRRQ